MWRVNHPPARWDVVDADKVRVRCRFLESLAISSYSAFNTGADFPARLDAHASHGHPFARDDSLYAGMGRTDGLAAMMPCKDKLANSKLLLPGPLVGWPGYRYAQNQNRM